MDAARQLPQVVDEVYRGYAGPAYGPLSDHAAGFGPTYTDALFHGERPMFFQSFGAASPDPAYALGVFYQSNSSNNWSGYRSTDTDSCLASSGRPELTWGQRVEEHRRCVEIVANDAPWLWIAQPGVQVNTHRDMTGINWYAGEAVDWSKVGYTT